MEFYERIQMAAKTAVYNWMKNKNLCSGDIAKRSNKRGLNRSVRCQDDSSAVSKRTIAIPVRDVNIRRNLV